MLKLITLYYKNYNYGGMLQAFALVKFLLINRLDALQLSYIQYSGRPKLSIFKRLSAPHLLRRIVARLLAQLITSHLDCRRRAFDKFADAVPHSDKILCANNIHQSVEAGDIFIAGSDQIWNPNWTEDAYFLDFVPERNGKIAYAASIGVNEAPRDFLEHVAPMLRRFDFISVREASAKEILQPYLEQEIKVVLDPTLLLSRADWDEIAIPPSVNEPYIFVYLLGEKRAHRTIIKKFARMLGLKIVFLPHILFRFNLSDCFFADYNLYDVGPAEFLGLIKNAEMVVTDSFHGCVFSIIYGKKFWALKKHKDSDQRNMDSRLYTLFDSLGLRDRLIVDEKVGYSADFLHRDIDYSAVEEKLNTLRKDSSDFLLNAIESVRGRMAKDNASVAD